ncbi:MAG: dihydrolipoyl dehydrogenase family protein, partial [Methyloceanibacter sp.]
FGIDVIEAQIDHRGVHDHVHGVIAALAPNDSIERFTGLGVRVIQAKANFLDKNTIEAGRFLVRARRFVIATGSVPVIPSISGLDHVPYFTNETIFNVGDRIQHLIVLGGGAQGLELAQAHSMLGSHVTIFDSGDFLPGEDPEATAILLKRLEDTQIMLYPNTRVEKVERVTGGIAVHIHKDDETVVIKGTHLLIATGRKPNVNSLSLERAGVTYTDGGIKVNEQLKTSNGRIYAVGDVIGGAHSTHLAHYQAGIVIRNALFRLKPDVSAGTIPRVIYTAPELAQVGLTEAEAHKRYRRRSIRIYRWPYADNDRAQCERETEGFIKVITKRDGTILGCTIVGAQAGELIQLWILAMAKEIKIGDMISLVLPSPTLSELSKRAVYAYYQTKLARGWLRSVIRLMRRFG